LDQFRSEYAIECCAMSSDSFTFWAGLITSRQTTREVVGAKGVMQQLADLGAHIVVPRPRHQRGDEPRQMVLAPVSEHRLASGVGPREIKYFPVARSCPTISGMATHRSPRQADLFEPVRSSRDGGYAALLQE